MAEYYFSTDFSPKIFFLLEVFRLDLMQALSKHFHCKRCVHFACHQIVCIVFFKRHIFYIRAFLKGKSIFFNTFHISLSFLMFFWSWFLTKLVFLFFIVCYTKLHCPWKFLWSAWSFVLKSFLKFVF